MDSMVLQGQPTSADAAEETTESGSKLPRYDQGGNRAATQRALLRGEHALLVNTDAAQANTEQRAPSGATKPGHEQSEASMATNPAFPRRDSSSIPQTLTAGAQPQSPEPAASLANTTPEEAHNGGARPDNDQGTVCMPGMLPSPPNRSIPSHSMQAAVAMHASSAEASAPSEAVVGRVTDRVLPLSPELSASSKDEPEQAVSTPTHLQWPGPHEQSTDNAKEPQGAPESKWTKVFTAAEEWARVL